MCVLLSFIIPRVRKIINEASSSMAVALDPCALNDNFCEHFCILFEQSDSVLSKTAIIPKKQGRKREISNKSARGWSLREANV